MKLKTMMRVLGAAVLLSVGGEALALDLPGPVVSAQWLSEHREDVIVLDVRDDLKSFTAQPDFEVDAKSGKKTLSELGGHIPGALLLDYSKVRVEREVNGRKLKGMLPDKAYFQTLLRDAGVGKDKPIIIAAPGETAEDLDTAARVYWQLKYYGQDAMAILDGGTAGWLEAGLPYKNDEATKGGGGWTAGAERRELSADSEEVAAAAEHKTQLVDARPLPFFLGLSVKKPTVQAAGHIAGAVDFPGEVRAQKTGSAYYFYSPAQYRSVFKAIGVQEQAATITYCNTGHLASGAWFVMSELLGNPHVKLYDGSMHQWTAENRPVVGLN